MEPKDKGNLKTELSKELDFVFSNLEGDDNFKKQLKEKIETASERIVGLVAKDAVRENLQVLFEYEKHYLELVKNYKEEIKFASALQEDLRKERAKFFAETLKEVSNTLQETKLDAKVTSSWIVDLVKSYTKSLDLSSDMAKEETLDIIGNIKKKAKDTVNDENVN